LKSDEYGADDDQQSDAYREMDNQLYGLNEQHKVVLHELSTGLELQPQDVGVGLSQIIPVLVAVLDGAASLVAIEQPELHVHPRIQVALGDLLIAGTHRPSTGTISERRLIVETHSEHLLLRLLRRIRETTEKDLPPGAQPFAPEELAVLYVEPSREGARVVELRVDESGEFIDSWPQGFFEERGEELFG
jgi:predicted ATPase